MKKVLFISYFWPPSGKASLHWPLDIIRHLPKNEIEPVILTVKEESFTQKDESLLSKVDPDWITVKSNALEPFNIYRKFIGKKKNEKLIASETISTENKSLAHKISLWIRLNLFIPDARIGWNFTAYRAAKKFYVKEKFDIIVSIGPPHSSHLIGLKLSKKLNLPHIPVLIDPWVDIVYYKNLKRSCITKKIDNHLEKSVLLNAEQVVFVTKSSEDDYLNKYEFLKNKTNVLYWGFDEDDFKNLPLNYRSAESIINKSEKVIVHAGNLFVYQNPKNFWQQIKSQNDSGSNYKIKFIGTVDPIVLDYLKEIGLQDKVETLGFLPYPQMIKQIFAADILLVCASEPRHVPGKLFEALRTGNPVIAFGDDNSEVKRIIESANSGMMFSYNDSCTSFFENFEKIKPDLTLIKSFDRALISKKFFEIIKNLLHKG
ncbi:MAG: glycosyltransferase [Ignavibacteriales bacterium]|nr:glycosyltransferase [Ignavibacterium sp.]MCO6447743.1 glycosyltransferase [Ignavibacterium album]MCZ2269075.1 glycosyltransferase [Ignavibacteriales bacterium]HOJ07986.1 glycosyltransferase [Ignavibacteriaceae bacterium]